MKKGRYGFTLVELLAVIVILSILLVIAVPRVISIIDDAKVGTLESTAKLIASSAEKIKTQNLVLGKEERITCENSVKLNDIDYETCYIEFEGNNAFVTIEGKEKFEGMYICKATKNDAKAVDRCPNEKVNLEILLYDGVVSKNQSGIYKEGTVIELEEPTKENSTFVEYMVVKGNSTLEGNKLTIGSEDTIIHTVYETWPTFEVDLDGGTDNVDYKEYYKSNTQIKLEEPTKENYKFTGWIVTEGNSSVSGDTITIGNENTVIKATWELNVFNLSVELNGGNIGNNPSGEYTVGSNITLEEPTKIGYTFTGWNVSGTGAVLSGTNLTVGAGDVTLTANWEINSYNVYFVGSGGNITGGTTLTNMVTNGSFENGSTGWSLGNASVITTQQYTGNNALKLNASVTAMSEQTMNVKTPTLNHKYYGRTMFLSSSDFTTVDARFEWYYGDVVGGLLTFAKKQDKASSWITKSNVLTQTSSTYLSNNWRIRNFLVNSSSDAYVDDVMIIDLTNSYGTGKELTDLSVLDNIPFFENNEYIYNSLVRYNSKIGTLPTISKTGYTFKNWYTEPKGNGTKVTSETLLNTASNMMVYANWDVNTYTISYTLNGGTVSTANRTSYTVETSTFTLNNPSKTGYTFTGWTGTGLSSSSTSVSITKGTTGNRTYTANWQAKTVAVTFDKNDGSGSTVSQTFTYGESGNKFGYNTDGTAKWGTSGDFGSWTRTNYKMLGWATSANATSKSLNIYTDVTDDWINNNSPNITLYAVWAVSNPTLAYSCKNGSKGSAPYVFTYTEDCTVIDDGNGNWRVKFLKTGNFTSIVDLSVDVFVVGGGASGSSGNVGSDNYTKYCGGTGGGGGYTTTKKDILITANTPYTITIGAGGSAGSSHNSGGKTTAFDVSANGGSGSSGGSGGGGGTTYGTAKKGGSDGASSSGSGQGTTTREFGETTGDLYAGGGGGGAGRYGASYGDEASGGSGGGGKGGGAYENGSNGGTNLGGGGGGGGGYNGGAGGSGIAIIRNKR